MVPDRITVSENPTGFQYIPILHPTRLWTLAVNGKTTGLMSFGVFGNRNKVLIIPNYKLRFIKIVIKIKKKLRYLKFLEN